MGWISTELVFSVTATFTFILAWVIRDRDRELSGIMGFLGGTMLAVAGILALIR